MSMPEPNYCRDGHTAEMPRVWVDDGWVQPYEVGDLEDRVSSVLGALGIVVFLIALALLTIFGTPEPKSVYVPGHYEHVMPQD